MPFIDEAFQFEQPDGTLIPVIGSGNATYAFFETPDGYTVIENEDTGFWEFARPDEKHGLLPSGVIVGQETPMNLEGLAKHLRHPPKKAYAIAQLKRKAMVDATKLAEGIEDGDEEEEAGVHLLSRWAQRQASFVRTLVDSPKETGTNVERPELHFARSSTSALVASGGIAAEVSSVPNDISPSVGTVVGVCLLVDFSDEPSTISQSEVTAFCNNPGYSNFNNNGSVFDYFKDQSGEKLSYTNQVMPWYRAKHPRSYYTDDKVDMPVRAHELIREALSAAVKSGQMNESQLSVDNKGYLYALNMFYAGTRVNSWGKGLWPHAFNLGKGFKISDRIKVLDYQLTDMTKELSLGTWVHENGHLICDFPDLYDVGYESNGCGDYCVMASGAHRKNPGSVCAYLKYKAGWATKVTGIEPGKTYKLPVGKNEYLLLRNPDNYYEYLIVENRVKKGRDSYLPDQGVAVWHVDEVLGNQEREEMTAKMHYECSLVQADGKHDLEKDINKGDDTDLFKKGGVFKSRKWWNGKNVGLELHINSAPGGTIVLNAVGEFKGTDEIISTRPTSPPVAEGISAACGKCEIM